MTGGAARPHAGRRTKIVATLGPATRGLAEVMELVAAGMDVARINLSHGSRAEHEASIANAREAARRCGAPVAVLVDLPGAKLRLGDMAEPLAVRRGDVVTLGNDRAGVPVNFPDMLAHFSAGDSVLVDDGAVALRVRAVTSASLTLEALDDGVLHSGKGVNAPDTLLPLPALTAADRDHVAWAVRHDADFIALSFVGSAGDVRELRDLISTEGGDQQVIAKIERRAALGSCEAIVAAADAVMVARGDLGVEIGPSDVPIWQKRIIHACHLSGRPVITATQMLQSMVTSPRPTRAEVSDVANAIYDATSAVMLSGETAVGLHPAASVRTMADIAVAVEADIAGAGRAPQPWTDAAPGISDAICHGACDVARRVGAAAIVTPTRSGATARAVARRLPPQAIIAITPSTRVMNQLALVWGIAPFRRDEQPGFEAVAREASRLAVAEGFAVPGDVVVVTAGAQSAQTGKTNLIKAHRIE